MWINISKGLILSLCTSLLFVGCKNDDMPTTVTEDNASGFITISFLRQDGGRPTTNDGSNEIRLISTEGDNTPATSSSEDYYTLTFPLRHANASQTLFFVTGLKTDDVQSLTAEEINGKMCQTQDYFAHSIVPSDVFREPYIYFGSVHKKANAPIPAVKMERAYAGITLNLSSPDDEDPLSGSSPRTLVYRIMKIAVENVPTQFSIGGMKTAYPANDDLYQNYTLFSDPLLSERPNSAYRAYNFFLPEHDPIDPSRRTYIHIECSQSLNVSNPSISLGRTSSPKILHFYIPIVEPFNSVDAGKIVRGKQYVINYKLPSLDTPAV